MRIRGGIGVGAVTTALFVIGMLVASDSSTAILTVAGIVTAWVAVAALRRPAVLAVAGLIGILSSRTLEHLTGSSMAGNLDEASVAICLIALPLIRVAQRKRLRQMPGQLYFVGFVALGVLSDTLNEVPATVALSGFILAVKCGAFAFAVAQVDWTVEHLRRGAKFGAVAGVSLVLTGLINLAFPDQWAAVFAIGGHADRRSGFLPSLIGPFVHPTEYALTMAFLAIAVAAWRITVSRSVKSDLLLVATVLGAILTFRRKTIVALLVIIPFLHLKTSRTKTVMASIVVAPLLIIATWTQISDVLSYTSREYLTDPNQNARIVLTLGAVDVAAEHFPLGAGFGRYGSFIAGQDYSPEYSVRGFNSVFGLGNTPARGPYLTDTQWPAVVGETGFLGGVLFLGWLVAFYRRVRRNLEHGDQPLVRWFGLMAMGWTGQMALESIANPVFYAPPLYGLFAMAVGVASGLVVSTPTSEPTKHVVVALAMRPPSSSATSKASAKQHPATGGSSRAGIRWRRQPKPSEVPRPESRP